MGSEVIIIPVMFGLIFGVIYLFFSTRNKERMALIEKGVGADIFNKGNRETAPIWKVFILNVALLLMGIGIGIFLATILDHYTSLGDSIYPATIFTTAGIGLFAGFNMTKNLDK
ncbi:MAG: hypothetical protein L3J14_01845 [Flavobacteriaceae bacterium]|nr:hypothetical protein [Flavobacteriaceae bacterium]